MNLKSLIPNKIKIDEKSCKNILIYYFGYVTIKYPKYVKTDSVNSFYIVISKMNEYFEINQSK